MGHIPYIHIVHFKKLIDVLNKGQRPKKYLGKKENVLIAWVDMCKQIEKGNLTEI